MDETKARALSGKVSGKVYSSARIFWNVRYSVPPRKGTVPAKNWKTRHPSAHTSDACLRISFEPCFNLKFSGGEFYYTIV